MVALGVLIPGGTACLVLDAIQKLVLPAYPFLPLLLFSVISATGVLGCWFALLLAVVKHGRVPEQTKRKRS